jgi:hypothetical protein
MAALLNDDLTCLSYGTSDHNKNVYVPTCRVDSAVVAVAFQYRPKCCIL